MNRDRGPYDDRACAPAWCERAYRPLVALGTAAAGIHRATRPRSRVRDFGITRWARPCGAARLPRAGITVHCRAPRPCTAAHGGPGGPAMARRALRPTSSRRDGGAASDRSDSGRMRRKFRAALALGAASPVVPSVSLARRRQARGPGSEPGRTSPAGEVGSDGYSAWRGRGEREWVTMPCTPCKDVRRAALRPDTPRDTVGVNNEEGRKEEQCVPQHDRTAG